MPQWLFTPPITSGIPFLSGAAIPRNMDVQMQETPETGVAQREWEMRAAAEDRNRGDANVSHLGHIQRPQDLQIEAFLQRLEAQARVERSAFGDQANQLCAQISQIIDQAVKGSYKEKAEKRKRQVESLSHEKSVLEKNHQELADKYAKLETQLRKTNEHLEKALQERNAQRRIAEGYNFANPEKIADDTIRSKWAQLEYNIRNLAHFLAKHATKDSVSERAGYRFGYASEEWPYWLKDEETRVFILQAYFWISVIENVFWIGGGRAWKGDATHSLKTTRQMLVSETRKKTDLNHDDLPLRQLTRWCAQGSCFLPQIGESNNQALRRIIQEEINVILTFLVLDDVDRNKFETRVENGLQDIFKGAMELDRMRLSSQAIFTVRWGSESTQEKHDIRYNEGVMEAEAWENALSAESIVEAFVSPYLEKVGNADGHNYDKSIVLVKAKVVCD